MFGKPCIVTARRVAGISQLMVAAPYHALQATHQAMDWMSKTLNDLLNIRDPRSHAGRVTRDFEELVKGLRVHALGGINNFHLLHASHDLDIPARALFGDTYCFGYGANSRWLNSTQTDQTSALGVHIAASKRKTAHVLRLSGVPVPRHSVAHDERHALEPFAIDRSSSLGLSWLYSRAKDRRGRCAQSIGPRASPSNERVPRVLPNPSLERGPSNGLAREAPLGHHPPRGPSRRWSAQLKR